MPARIHVPVFLLFLLVVVLPGLLAGMTTAFTTPAVAGRSLRPGLALALAG